MENEIPFPVVGIGASAGGIDALQGLFKALPAAPGLAFVVVTHLLPDRDSHLGEVLSRFTTMRVDDALDMTSVQVDTIYVVPSDSIIEIEGGKLRITPLTEVDHKRNPIDTFFRSLAIDQQEYAAGVVLSGMNSDGTLGIRDIKENGGTTYAQTIDDHGPRFSAMPQNAIATGAVDFALPVSEMGIALAAWAQRFTAGKKSLERLLKPADGAAPIAIPADIHRTLEALTGHDFSCYKQATLLRRVLRRMQVRQITEFSDYINLLQDNPTEAQALFHDLLINVTAFFRDSDAFESLRMNVLPALFDGRGAKDTVRVWISACSTGEEVYSVAMLLREYADTLSQVPTIKIYATDIDESALDVARRGRYSAAIVEKISANRLRRFFTQNGDRFVIAKEVRDLCVFSTHSVIRDPPFSRIDLITCRNLLIYLDSAAQERAIDMFRYALNPGGHLFIGASESLGHNTRSFTPVDREHRVFRKHLESIESFRVPEMLRNASQWQHLERSKPNARSGADAFQYNIQTAVLRSFATPYVVVDSEGEILSYSPRTGRYLEAPSGAPTREIFTVAREPLRLPIRAAFREAAQSRTAVTRDGISITDDAGHMSHLSVSIAPLELPEDSGRPLFIVLFHEHVGPRMAAEPAGRVIYTDTTDLLERELRDTRERLQSLMEEYTTAIEELKSSNEELVSSNEELESSKEELQSVNEELHATNASLLEKVDALDRANGDLHNLFESTDVATVFLDKERKIRSFTPVVSEIFSILPTDRGRPITDLTSRLSLPGFSDDISLAYANAKVVERRVEHEQGNAHFLMRIAPYRNASQVLDGVVINFTRVSTLSFSERRQHMIVAELQHRTRNLLTVVQSIARQTLPEDNARESFIERLSALARVQSLLSQELDDRINIAEIVRFELHAHGADDSDRVTVSGPRVALNRSRVQTLSLALHELTTNAVKYGALKHPEGRLEILWELIETDEEHKTVRFIWQEYGVELSSKTYRRGFGHALIEQVIPYNLSARTNLTFGSGGLKCVIEIPLIFDIAKRDT